MWVLLVYRQYQDGVTCSDMIFTFPWNSASISDIGYGTLTGENGNSETEVQIFNIFVAKADIAHTTKHFQFHKIMDTRLSAATQCHNYKILFARITLTWSIQESVSNSVSDFPDSMSPMDHLILCNS
jgi:hypothetical protein